MKKNRNSTSSNWVKFGQLQCLFFTILDGNESAVEDISRSYFACAAPSTNPHLLPTRIHNISVNKLCTNPNATCTDLSYCPIFTPGNETAPATLTVVVLFNSDSWAMILQCTGKKWIHKGEYQELTEEPVCKADGNDAVFHIDNEKIQGGICFTDCEIYYHFLLKCILDCSDNCKNHSKLDYPDCKDGGCEDDLDYSDDMMKCKNDKLHIRFEMRVLIFSFCALLSEMKRRFPHSFLAFCSCNHFLFRVYIRSNNTFDRATQFYCNKATGYWEWSNKTVLPEGTQVLCVGELFGSGTSNLTSTSQATQRNPKP